MGRVGFFSGLPPWLANGCLLPVSSHGIPSVRVFVLISSSCKDTAHWIMVHTNSPILPWSPL